jgi:hypothetical protein
MRLTFDGFEKEYSAVYTVKPLAEFNRDVIAFTNQPTTAALTAAYFKSDIGFAANSSLSGLNNLRMVAGDTGGYLPILRTSLGILNSGTAQTDFQLGSGNVSYSIRYGTTLESGITSLSELPAGVHTVTMKLTYDNLGTADVEDDRFLLQNYTVTVLTPAATLAAALAELRPGNIVNNGEVTAEEFELPLKQTTNPIAGVSYSWAVEPALSPNASIEDGVLTITRLYTQDKVTLRATVNMPEYTDALGARTRTFEFRVLPESKVEIASRLDKLITDVFERAPRIYDVSGGKLNDLVANLNDFLSEEDLGIDKENATIVWSVSDSSVQSLQNSASNLATNNLVFVDPSSNQLKLGQNALKFNGDVNVTVTATIEIRFDDNNIAADVTTSESFNLKLVRDELPIGTIGSLVLIESGVGNYAYVLIGDDSQGASVSKAQLVIKSGTEIVVNAFDVPYGFDAQAGIRPFSVVPSQSGAFANPNQLIPELLLTYGNFFVDGVPTTPENVARIQLALNTVQSPQAKLTITSGLFINSGTNGALEAKELFSIELTNGQFRTPLIALNSGVIKLTDSGNNLLEVTAVNLLQISPTVQRLIIKTSGAADMQSGIVEIEPGAYYKFTNSDSTAKFGAITVANDVADTSLAQSGIDNRILLTLTGAVWNTTVSSGNFSFSENSAAILSGLQDIGVGKVEIVSPTELLITPSSGLVESGTSSVTVTSGAFIQFAQTVSLDAVSSRVETLSGVALGATTGKQDVVITLSGLTGSSSLGAFRTVAQGFSASDIIFTASGVAGSAELAQAQYAASVISSVLADGLNDSSRVVFSSNNEVLTIKLDGLGENLVTIANTIFVTVRESAILVGDPNSDTDKLTFTATR